MASTTETSKVEVEQENSPKKANQFKGIMWSIVHGLTALIYLLIPTKLIISFKIFL